MTAVPYFDSHLHLTDDRFADDLADVLGRARAAGVAGMVTVGTDPADARRARDLAAAEEGVWCTGGLHPHRADAFSPDVLAELEELLAAPEVAAVGETGLDFHYDNAARDAQRTSFRAHLELAERTGLPVVVHSRDADEETADLLGEFAGRVRGVLHCFTGGDGLLEAGLDADWYVSFSGIATFASWDGAERVRRVPDERLLVETDSPYLAPVPERGKRNEPAFVAHTCRALAEMRGEAPEATARLTDANARRFYGLDAAGEDG